MTAFAATLTVEPPLARAQSMLDMVDFTSDQFTKAEMSRADIEVALEQLPAGGTLDLSGRALNKLDLSDMDLRRTRLQAANQSMGLMRSTFRNTDLEGASFKGANLRRTLLEYTSLKGADLSGASLTGSELGGSDFTGANVAGADFENADVNSARIGALLNSGDAKNLDKAKNLDRADRN